jgi:hypothetical protein
MMPLSELAKLGVQTPGDAEIARREILTIVDIRNAVQAFKTAKETDRKRWCTPETVFFRGERCYRLAKRTKKKNAFFD